MGRPLLLSLLLLLFQTCIPASWGLQCMLCGRTGKCQVEECAPGQDLCRTTVMRMWEVGDELEVVERGCAHPEKSNRTMSYRTGVKIITLTEAVCGSDLCNRPRAGRPPTFPRTRSRYLECVSCASSDLSCERGWVQSLQCRSPGEQCLEVVTHRTLEGEPQPTSNTWRDTPPPTCPDPRANFLGFCVLVFFQVVELQNLPLNGLQCYSCEGNSTHGCSSEETSLTACRGPMSQCLEATGSNGLGNPSYTVRGCATPSWCQSLHVAEAFSLTHLNVSCCSGNGCNHPVLDRQPRTGGAARRGPAHLSLTVTLLISARLWGGTLLWT
uniref:urokinase plasminogen activator surface receptor isoform X1 n=1 Tax=Panthera onca TaxID=9690 RepID=UPI00295442C6|nr:urokinase plasminogen activator surface receptor isoform X1 [Panthera onca]